MSAEATVLRPVDAFAGGDPNSMTCHLCHGKPSALCVRCWTVVCKAHSPSCCDTPRYVGTDAPGWKTEADRRYKAWKGTP